MLLRIDRTWTGQPAPAAAIHAARQGDHVVLRALAPGGHDPLPAGPPGPTPRLWEHEVVEWFCVGADGRYLEVELGPGGHHLVLQLAGVRQVTAQGLPLDCDARRVEGWWAAWAAVPLAWLPPPPWRAAGFRLHGPPEARVHLLSVALPGAVPDFHQPGHFPPVGSDLPAADGPADAEACLTAVRAGLDGGPPPATLVAWLASARKGGAGRARGGL
ncbi:MAG: hypothetical protein H6732_14565 [Alphaproteobacteria bacterium]|nr:hypothetical protein [Alphaproteobacteria bacterium]